METTFTLRSTLRCFRSGSSEPSRVSPGGAPVPGFLSVALANSSHFPMLLPSGPARIASRGAIAGPAGV